MTPPSVAVMVYDDSMKEFLINAVAIPFIFVMTMYLGTLLALNTFVPLAVAVVAIIAWEMRSGGTA